MKIAIVGAGLTGAYLYRFLRGTDHAVDLFDVPSRTKCGLSPCAWGTSKDFFNLAGACHMDGSAYILTRSDDIVIDGLRIRGDLMTFDKPRLIRDMLEDARIDYSMPDAGRYDRLIDATGVARRLLPPVHDDIVLRCVQYRIRTDEPLNNQIRLGGIGYAWIFPLSEQEYHVGCGSLVLNPNKLLRELGWIEDDGSLSNLICACGGSIRLTGPHFSQPFVSTGEAGEVWGVGEAIGCVAPLAGDGIVPGMRSVQLLMDRWDDPAGYTRAILKEFAWMKDERRVVDKLRNNEELDLKDAWVLKKNSKRMAMEVGLIDAMTLMRHLS